MNIVTAQAEVDRLAAELELAKMRLQEAKVAAPGNLFGAELLLSLATVLDGADRNITFSTKRREALAWACRIAAAHVPEMVAAQGATPTRGRV